MSKTDEQLMQQYCAGDAAAFDTLYARYRGPVFRYVQRLCAQCIESEELYQDVWVRMVRARDQWQDHQAFSPWLFRIAHNRVVDHFRSMGKAELLEINEPEAIPGSGLLPEALALLRDCVERLMALLGELPENQRSAFLLKEEAGLSLAQIGEVTGVERETVKSRLRYALKRLRSNLEGCDD